MHIQARARTHTYTHTRTHSRKPSEEEAQPSVTGTSPGTHTLSANHAAKDVLILTGWRGPVRTIKTQEG